MQQLNSRGIGEKALCIVLPNPGLVTSTMWLQAPLSLSDITFLHPGIQSLG